MVILSLLGLVALVGGFICFQGYSVDNLGMFSFSGLSGNHVIGAGLFLLGIVLLLRVRRHD